MLPDDKKKYIPDPLLSNIDNNGQALIDYLNTFCAEEQEEILNIYYMKYPEIVKSIALDAFGEYIAAGIKSKDDDRTKRQKIYRAVETHGFRSTWENNAKLVIDDITGLDSELVKSTTVFEDDDSIIVADNSVDNVMYSTIGTDGVNDFGTYIPEIIASVALPPGFVAIDVGFDETDIFDIQDDDSVIVSDNSTSNLFYSSIGVDGIDSELGTFIPAGETSQTIEDILDEIEEALVPEIAPAYEIIYLGYRNDDGTYIVLRTIQ